MSLQEVTVGTWADQLGYEREMIIVLPVGFTFLRIEQVVSSDELEKHASQGPDVGALIVLASQDDFGRSVLARLDDIRVVMILIASVAHVAELHLDVLLPHALNVVMGPRSHLFCFQKMRLQPRLRAHPEEFPIALLERVRQRILRVGVLRRFLRRLLEEVVLVLDWPRSSDRYAPLLLHYRDHFVLGLDFFDLLAEFQHNHFRLRLLLLFPLLFLAEHHVAISAILPLIILVILAGRILILLLLHELLPLLAILLLLVLELLGVQNDRLVGLEEFDEGATEHVLVEVLELLLLGQREDDVLGLQVGVDYPADSVHVVEAEEELAGQAPHDRDGDAAVVVLLDQAEQVLPEHLHGHRVVLPVDRMVEELIKHLQVVRVVARCLELRVIEMLPQELGPLRVLEVLGNFIKNLFFLEGGIDVLLGTFLYLQGVELLI